MTLSRAINIKDRHSSEGAALQYLYVTDRGSCLLLPCLKIHGHTVTPTEHKSVLNTVDCLTAIHTLMLMCFLGGFASFSVPGSLFSSLFCSISLFFVCPMQYLAWDRI